MISFFKTKKASITSLFNENFIDIHSHLLPNIDDGSKSFEESLTLVKRLQNFGIQNFVVTPHVMDGVWNNSSTNVKNKLFELNTFLKKERLEGVSIRAAAEYLLDSHFEKLLETEKLLTIKDNFLLVELSYLNPPLNLNDILFKIQIAGYKPILAHPERYAFYHNNFKEYLKLKEAGCLFQLNLLSLSNYYGISVQKIAKKLLKESLIDFVGSDTHNHRHLDFLESIKDRNLLKLVKPIIDNNSLLL